jgi:thiamine transport system substrate-binding protein
VTGCYRSAIACLVALVVLAGAACGGGGKPSDVVLVTHDSFVVSKGVKRAFEQETGFKLKILQSGDAGEMLTKALLTAGNPQGDVLFGVDNTLLSRALDGDVFEPYRPPALDTVDPQLDVDAQHRVTPIDHGEVCLNVDKAWFADRGLAAPRSIDDLTDQRYKGLLVVENPATSSPGLAFLLATIARYGDDGWQDYWRRLRANNVLVVDGWEEAYTARFSGAAGSKGNRPIVVSYASSPPAEVIYRTPRPSTAPTGVIEDSCFRQIEFAGVLRGAHNKEGARKLVDFMLSKRFQEDIPLSMFVFPVHPNAKLPRAFEKFAVVPEHPLDLPPSQIEANRDDWIKEWTDIVVR